MPKGHYPRQPGLKRSYQTTDPQKRFWAKVQKTPEGCWLWQGSRSKAGYGPFNLGRRGEGYALAHRFSYEKLVGPIPAGQQLDHLCRTPLCVNPAHVEPVSNRENFLRSSNPRAIAHTQQTCNRGHPATPENTYSSKGVIHYCRVCRGMMRQKKGAP